MIFQRLFERLSKDQRSETNFDKEETYLELAPYHFQYFINLVSLLHFDIRMHINLIQFFLSIDFKLIDSTRVGEQAAIYLSLEVISIIVADSRCLGVRLGPFVLRSKQPPNNIILRS